MSTRTAALAKDQNEVVVRHVAEGFDGQATEPCGGGDFLDPADAPSRIPLAQVAVELEVARRRFPVIPEEGAVVEERRSGQQAPAAPASRPSHAAQGEMWSMLMATIALTPEIGHSAQVTSISRGSARVRVARLFGPGPDARQGLGASFTRLPGRVRKVRREMDSVLAGPARDLEKGAGIRQDLPQGSEYLVAVALGGGGEVLHSPSMPSDPRPRQSRPSASARESSRRGSGQGILVRPAARRAP